MSAIEELQPTQQDPGDQWPALELALKYFWQQIGADEIGSLPDSSRSNFYDKRSIVEAFYPLVEHSLKRPPEGFVFGMQLGPEDDDYKSVDFGDLGWIPATRAEAKLAIIGADKWVQADEIKGIEHHQPAVKSRYRKIKNRWQTVKNDIATLDKVKVYEPDQETRFDIKLARENSELIKLLARHLHAQESFGKWQRRNTNSYKNRAQYYEGLITALAKYASDELFSELLASEDKKTRAEFRFWTDQNSKLDRSMGGIAAKALIRKDEEAALWVAEDNGSGNKAVKPADRWREATKRAARTIPVLTEAEQKEWDRRDRGGYASGAIARGDITGVKATTREMLRGIGEVSARRISESLDPEASAMAREAAHTARQHQIFVDAMESTKPHETTQ